MFDSLSEVWIAGIVLVILAIAGIRWIVAKTTGKQIANDDILGDLRTKITQAIASNIDLIDIEENQGRDAVKTEIEKQIKNMINAADFLTDTEKTIILSLDMGKVVDLIEKELVNYGILKAE